MPPPTGERSIEGMQATLVLRASASPRTEITAFWIVTVALATALTVAQRALGVDMHDLEGSPPEGLALIPFLAAAPGIAALATRLVFHATLRGAKFGWRLPSARYALISYGLPFLYVPSSFALLYATGLGGFKADVVSADIFASAAMATVVIGVLALFEEVGWRGYLVPALARLVQPKYVALVSGVMWSVYHWPLILLVPGADQGVPGRLRGRCASRSRSSASASHSPGCACAVAVSGRPSCSDTSHNILIYSVFDPLTLDLGRTAYFQGEQGILLALVSTIVGVAFARATARICGHRHGRVRNLGPVVDQAVPGRPRGDLGAGAQAGLPRMRSACVSAVRSVITSTSAIWRLVNPRPIKLATSRSRVVSALGSLDRSVAARGLRVASVTTSASGSRAPSATA